MVHTSDVETTSSTEDEEESDVEELDTEFLQAFAKIKQRDASIYDTERRLFDDEDGSDSQANGDVGAEWPPGQKKDNPKFLRQVLAEQALEGGVVSDSDSDDDVTAKPLTYTQEQLDLKNAFLQAAGEAEQQVQDGEFGKVLQRRPKKSADAAAADQSDPVIKELLVKCFGPGDAESNPEDAFLRDYVQGQQWKDDGEPSGVAELAPTQPEAPEDLDDDLQFTQEAERFEASFNFRFEEPGAEHAVTHPRNPEGVVRKKDERRKLARERRAKRKEEELRRQQEDAKKARKAARAEKRRQAETGDRAAQMAELEEAAGRGAPDSSALQALMESEDWDPAAYDAAMASAFGEDYYDAADEFGEAEAPLEDEAAEGDADAVPAARIEQPGNTLEDDDDGEDVAPPPGGRFRYRQVPKQNYGLDVLDILTLDSKELNQVVGLKRLAPYREEGRRQYADTKKLEELRRQQQRPQRQKGSKRKQLEVQRQRHPNSPAVSTGLVASPDAARPAASKPAAQRPDSASSEPGKKLSMEGQAAKDAQHAARGSADRAKAEQSRRRLQSYGKLTLRQDGEGKKGAKRKAEVEASPQGSGLTKGERKRLKRSERRAQKRAAQAGIE